MDTNSKVMVTDFRSQTGSMDGESRRIMARGIPPAPTITPEKIGCVMSDVQTQIDGLQLYLIELGVAKARVTLHSEKGWAYGDRDPS